MNPNKVNYESIKIVNEEDYDIKVAVEHDFIAKVFAISGEKGEKGDPGVGAVWGTLEGDIDDQTDLKDKLDDKLNVSDVDSELDPTSENPLENQAIYAALSTLAEELELKIPKIEFDTVANWNAKRDLISEPNTIYIYTDYQQIDNKNIPGVKVGDGNAYLIDIPFIDILYYLHINNDTIHITDAERDFWNNKVTCYTSLEDEEQLIFSKN